MSCMQDTTFPSLSTCIFIKLMNILRYILKIQPSKQLILKVQHFSHQSPTLKIILSHFYPCPILTIITSIMILMLHSHPNLGLPSDHKPRYSKQNLVCIPCLIFYPHARPKTRILNFGNIQILCIYW